MRVLIATVQVPFIRGGAEILAEGLHAALLAAGHSAEMVSIPFAWNPSERILDHLLACRLMDLTKTGGGEPVDRLIGLKFPAYLIPHPHKVLWLVHQFRQAYDLWNHFAGLSVVPNGEQIRQAVEEADCRLIPEARAVYTIAANVSQRLHDYCHIESTPIYHPPQDAERFHNAGADDYFFFPSRCSAFKRQDLVLEALAQTRQPVRVRFAGTPDMPSYGEKLKSLAASLKVERRVQWLGQVSDEEKRQQYARARGVIFPPLDEDYGYVTLEAMLSSKAVITCSDSGGPLEFIRPEQTGLVVEPTAEALAAGMDRLWSEPKLAAAWGEAGRRHYMEMGISWQTVVERLLS